MTRAEAFDKAWRLGFKGDFTLYDEIYHHEFKGVLEEVKLNIEAFKERLYNLRDFIIFTSPKTLIKDDTFLKLYGYNKLKEADVFTSVTIFLKYKEGRIIHQAYAFEELDYDPSEEKD